MQQLHPVDSKNMISVADHGWVGRSLDNYIRNHPALPSEANHTISSRGFIIKREIPSGGDDKISSGDDDTNNVFPWAWRKFYWSPKDDNQEGRYKPIQMMSPESMNFDDTPDCLNESVGPKSIVDMTVTSRSPKVVMRLFGVDVARTKSKSSKPGTIHQDILGGSFRRRSGSVPHSYNKWTNKRTSGTRVRKNVSVISRARNNRHRETDSGSSGMPLHILDNQAQAHCTGYFNMLSNLRIGPENIVLVAANGGEMETFMSGSVRLRNLELDGVHYCPDLDLGNRTIVSGSMLDNDDYGYQFRQGKFTVKDLRNGTIVGEGRLVDGNYILDYLKIPRDRSRVPEQPGLVTTVWNAVCSALHRLGLKY